MALPRLENAEVGDRRVLVRVDLDGALDSSGKIRNPAVLAGIRPTVELLIQRGAAVLLASHSGPRDAKSAATLAPLVPHLNTLFGRDVRLLDNAPGPDGAISDAVTTTPGGIYLLENLFRNPGEAAGDRAFARELARLADLYVNDAFGASRENFASMVELPKLIPACAGLGLYKEVTAVEALLSRNNKPLVFLLGGVRLERKLRLLGKLLEKIDTVLLGGGLAFTFLKSRAVPVGASFVERDLEVPAFQMLEKADLSETEWVLPLDHIAAEQMSRDSKNKSVAQNGIPDRWMGLDVGPKTISRFEKTLKSAGAILWHGPLGAVEIDRFQKGTAAVANAIAKSKAHSVAIGADTVRMIYEAGLADRFAHLSSSSDAVLDLLMGTKLPGLAALQAADEA